jgi:hypothetical protein
MANLGANPVWDDIKNAPGNAETAVLGPSYSYSDNIPGPTSLGVGSDGSFSQLFSNLGASIQYVKVMLTGDPPLGNAYFVNTGGTCTAPDGSTQSRMNFINNFPSGRTLLPKSLNELSFLTSDLNGLVPGVVGDIEGLNPVYLFNAMTADGTPACSCYSCTSSTGTKFGFLTPELTPDFDADICTVVDPSNCKTTESFSNYSPAMSALPTILAAVGLGILTFSGK